VILGLTLGPTPLQALALVASPRLGLQHKERFNKGEKESVCKDALQQRREKEKRVMVREK
jgi:hypothetical protein